MEKRNDKEWGTAMMNLEGNKACSLLPVTLPYALTVEFLKQLCERSKEERKRNKSGLIPNGFNNASDPEQ